MFAYLAMAAIVFIAAAVGCVIADLMPAQPAPEDFKGDEDA